MHNYDIQRNWDAIQPLLDHPEAKRALDIVMECWCAFNPWLSDWDPSKGPWFYSISDRWLDCHEHDEAATTQIDRLFRWCFANGYPDEDDPNGISAWKMQNFKEYADKRGEFLADILPRPGTPDWYRCYDCRQMAIWDGTIGRLLMPYLSWLVMWNSDHAFAAGFHEISRADDLSGGIIFDILDGHLLPPHEIVFAEDGELACSTVDQYINLALTATKGQLQLAAAGAWSRYPRNRNRRRTKQSNK